MNDKTETGSRKVILTKWMLIIFSIGTFGYMVLSLVMNCPLPESFYMNFVLGLGAIGGAFTVGNIFEHRAQGQVNSAKAQAEGEKQKTLARTASENTPEN
ncbi:hypothetical protein QUF75_01960 [Desulfococcaceae bacterium HSG7]|nr:hypothetical protein [Desulfococcaceae bacterium HSG7]